MKLVIAVVFTATVALLNVTAQPQPEPVAVHISDTAYAAAPSETKPAPAEQPAPTKPAFDENNPTVTSIVGNKVKVTRRLSGSLYVAPEIEKLAPEFVKAAVRKYVDRDAVEKYQDEHDGKLPSGVEVAARKYSMTIKVVE